LRDSHRERNALSRAPLTRAGVPCSRRFDRVKARRGPQRRPRSQALTRCDASEHRGILSRWVEHTHLGGEEEQLWAAMKRSAPV
jgi:hypothetical protein